MSVYEDFFGVARAPFRMAPDPDFFFRTTAHCQALAGLQLAASDPNGIVLLTGDAGTGKTVLLRSLTVPRRGMLCYLAHPTVGSDDFLELLLLELGLDPAPPGKARQLTALHRLLHQRQRILLLLDEAHHLAGEVLEEIRLLANLDHLAIVLSGQPELDLVLDRPGLRQLKQRVAHRFVLAPLRAGDVGAYVDHRWRRAGAVQPHPFSEDSLDYLAFFSGGIPRVINAICDNALSLAFSEARREVRPEDIVGVAKHLVCTSGEEARKPEMALVWDNPKRPRASL